LAGPNYLHWLAATVFQEELFDDVLVCVFSPEVDDLEQVLFLFDLFGFLELLAVKSRACASDSEGHFFVTAIADDDVKSVIKLLNFIGNTEDIDCFGLARLEHVVTLDDLPDRFLLFGERGVLGLDFGCVCDPNAFFPGLKDWF
jgi:hypothetical protein